MRATVKENGHGTLRHARALIRALGGTSLVASPGVPRAVTLDEAFTMSTAALVQSHLGVPSAPFIIPFDDCVAVERLSLEGQTTPRQVPSVPTGRVVSTGSPSRRESPPPPEAGG